MRPGLAAALALGGIALGGAVARADMPSPLFCITLELCETASSCQPHRHWPPFVLRQTNGEWLQHYGPRGTDAWVFIAPSTEIALAQAPAGAQIALVEAGVTAQGAIVLNEHRLEGNAVSVRFIRHQCETNDGGGT